MRTSSFIIALILFANLAQSQSSAVYEELDKLYSSNKVFMLGEDRHGVKTIDSFKVNLCKRIIKDTSIVVFESGITESFLAYRRNNFTNTQLLYPVWRNKYYDDFLRFIKQRDIIWFGIDIQPNSFLFSKFIDSVLQKCGLKKENINLDSSLVYFSLEKQKLSLSQKEIKKFINDKNIYLDFYNQLLNNLAKISAVENLNKEQELFLKQVILSRIMLIDEIIKPIGKTLIRYRDSCMYENFHFFSSILSNKASHYLIMSHNYHISHKFDNYMPLGEYIYNSEPKSVSVGIYLDSQLNTKLLPKNEAKKNIRKNSDCDFYISLNGIEQR
ncbi:MAG TPA: hypothetical protein VNZ49_15210 [Bacteroidia bacterium]|jgi:erythromycin esterase-like protein|nr:hypothetical protein [Bacteroidia bacterium]